MTKYLDIYKTHDYFRKCYESSDGEIARQYLLSRKISLETADLYNIGYSPDAYLGYTQWRRRLIFPLFNTYGDLIGFSGRLLTYKHVEPNGDKYVLELGTNKVLRVDYSNGQRWESSDKVLYHDSIPKSVFLYGLNEAKEEIKDKNYCVIVEGQFDVFSMAQGGIRNVVGKLGSALTTHQLLILYRYCDYVIFLFDSDEAGYKSLMKSSKEIMFDYGFLNLPEGYDPAQFYFEYGIDPIKEQINNLLTNKGEEKKDLFSLFQNNM